MSENDGALSPRPRKRVRDAVGRLIFRLGFHGVAGWWDAGTDSGERHRGR